MRAPLLIQKMFPSITWRMPGDKKKIFLTFDDGPIPEVTPWVIETLSKYNAKATFFCIGENVVKHPQVFDQLKSSGHQIGNHTYHHMNGWKVTNNDYYKDIEECNKLVDSPLFRPPYGKIKPSQIRHLKNKYKLVMWDVLSRDYDRARTGEQCMNTVKQESEAGSIIVFHDSLKAQERLRIALPGILKHFSEQGFEFARLEFDDQRLK
ncbi:MAG: polysaccharide deacetylase family protein [Bacteroidia bacterium]|nr:polysaccharide deacetylase family protein [Bacteroidia bacterium]